METKDGIKTFCPKSADDWRKWLQKYHDKEPAVFLIIYKKSTGIPSLSWEEAVKEALCFGWIDSKRVSRDQQSYYQYFTRRKPKSNWSRINKQLVEKLIRERKMRAAGMKAIEIARQNGSWNSLDEMENLEVPKEMESCLRKNRQAYENWKNFSPSVRKVYLGWILSAKRAETQTRRIEKSVSLIEQNIRVIQP